MTDQFTKDALNALDVKEKKWKPVGQQTSDTWNFETQGELVGKYLRTEKVQTKMGEGTKHFFKLDDGMETSCWGCTMLNNIFGKDVLPGLEVQIKYLGKKQGKRGMFKAYAVSVAE